MNDPKFGRLSRIDLRKAWKREDTEFTPWLAEPDNLALLGETIGLELELEATERNVGPFRADILCKDPTDGTLVLIENQIERTDHTHLGQIITYAAGMDAVKIVWIASRFTEEHRAALDWLNTISHENIRFFGLEVELWQIANSPIAPKFNIVAKPNDWSKSVRETAAGGTSPERRAFCREFWSGFVAHLEASQSRLKYQRTPSAESWMNWTLGKAAFQLGASFNSRENCIDATVMVYEHELYRAIAAKKPEIENLAGETSLIWDFDEGRKQNYVRVRRTGIDPSNKANWPQCWSWLREKMETLDRVFRPIVAEVRASSSRENE